MISVALFNNKGGVGKTTLAYHLAHMMARTGISVLAVDLDPQADLTAHFLGEPDLEGLWGGDEEGRQTIAGAVWPIVEGLGDIRPVSPINVAESLWLLAGDLALSRFEERLAQEWSATLAGGNTAAFRVSTSFYRIIMDAARYSAPEVILIDVGSNLGALNRAGLLAADRVIVPLGADLLSAQGLRNLGPSLMRWRRDWQDTVLPRNAGSIDASRGEMIPLGYVVMQPSMRLDRPVKAYESWLDKIPEVYATSVLGDAAPDPAHRIATVRNFRSLMPLAHEARKPMFDLRAADGAIGSTQRYVQLCLSEFRSLTEEVLARLRAPVPNREA